MCGRYTLSKAPDHIRAYFGLGPNPLGDLRPRYNIAPSQSVLGIRQAAESAQREPMLATWGLIPSWSRDPKGGARPINARAETIAARPTFRDSFRSRRCLIAADGFYEWQSAADSSSRKQPWYIQMQGGGLFAFGGLWDRWRDPQTGNLIESCAIITTAPNPLLARLHDRMPLILAPGDFEQWLSPSAPSPTELLRPYPEAEMQMYPVSPLVGSPANDRPECCQRMN